MWPLTYFVEYIFMRAKRARRKCHVYPYNQAFCANTSYKMKLRIEIWELSVYMDDFRGTFAPYKPAVSATSSGYV